MLILDRITDVRNFGAILRTAEATGVHAVVIPSKSSAQLNSGTIKSSAGAIFKVPICRSDNLKDTIDFLTNSGLKIAAATEKAEDVYYHADLSGPLALILGSEGEGVSGEYLKRATIHVKIPMLGEIESLNVSVAAGVLMYEIVRQSEINSWICKKRIQNDSIYQVDEEDGLWGLLVDKRNVVYDTDDTLLRHRTDTTFFVKYYYNKISGHKEEYKESGVVQMGGFESTPDKL